RFSYMSEIRIRNQDDSTEWKITEPKRFTYLLGKNEKARTAADRFYLLKSKAITLDDLLDAFNVDKLTKEFFRRYKDFHEEGWKHIASVKSYLKLFKIKEGATKEETEKNQKPVRD